MNTHLSQYRRVLQGEGQPQQCFKAGSLRWRRPRSRGHRPWQAARCSVAEQALATLDRRRLLAAGLLSGPLLIGSGGPAAADTGAQTFMSSEGFAFEYPADWVVAFDRSGSVRGNGAVMVAGNFRTFETVSVFRTEVPAADLPNGLTEELGFRLALEPQQKEASTMRFRQLGSALTSRASCSNYYDYEYEIETCRGEIIEGVGGKIQCLGPQGQYLQTLRRHHLGRAVLVKGYLYTLNASATVERWPDMQPTMAVIVSSFRC